MLKPSILVLALLFCGASSAQTYFGANATAKPARASAAAAVVDVLSSGVRVEHLARGAGASPSADTSVTVHYRGTLVATGAEFDSSYRRGRAATFNLRQVIPCWTEGIQRLAVGGKGVLVCPAHTAYGQRGAGNVVPPNQDLRFEVELLGVN